MIAAVRHPKNQAVAVPHIRHIECRISVACDYREINCLLILGVRDVPNLEATPTPACSCMLLFIFHRVKRFNGLLRVYGHYGRFLQESYWRPDLTSAGRRHPRRLEARPTWAQRQRARRPRQYARDTRRAFSQPYRWDRHQDPAGRFFFHIMASLAQMERERIVERTRAGLAAARKLGRIGGRKRRMTDNKINAARRLLTGGTPPRDVAENLGVSVPTLYRWLPASART